jgi:8-oxo-dGTP pyrophosphatase MutT (NUDIX family)
VEEAPPFRPQGLGLTATVRAAGGVPWRRRADGDVEVLLVHRPRYLDWTFPKGKVEPGETDEQAALREVEEETGLRCELGAELVGTTYRDPKLRTKIVRYWAMKPLQDDAVPQHEVDEVEWLPRESAADRLSHERDLDVLWSLDRVV